MQTQIDLESEIRRLMDLAARSRAVIHVGRSADRLSSVFPGVSKPDIFEMIIKEGAAAKVGMELEYLP